MEVQTVLKMVRVAFVINTTNGVILLLQELGQEKITILVQCPHFHPRKLSPLLHGVPELSSTE
jgi:hypothetical protein